MKRIILLVSICFICIVSVIGLILLHHSTDYDVSSVVLKAHVFLFQKPKNVSVFSKIHHVFIIVEENHDWKDIYKNSQAPFINRTLLKEGSYAQRYYNVPQNLHPLHPSEPNYIMLEAGSITFADHTFTTDDVPSLSNSTNSHDHLAFLLNQKKFSWKSYQEDISGTDCPLTGVNNYAPKHTPFVYFRDVSGSPPDSSNRYCIQHMRPITELWSDIASHTIANYAFITPDLQHDMHDGTIQQADTWLASVVPMITNSADFKKDGVLFITWDEGGDTSDENKAIGMIALSPFIKKGYTNSISYSHASYIKTIEEIFYLSPLLGIAADKTTRDLSDFFN